MKSNSILLIVYIIALVFMVNISTMIFNIFDAWIGIAIGVVSIPLLAYLIISLLIKMINGQ